MATGLLKKGDRHLAMTALLRGRFFLVGARTGPQWDGGPTVEKGDRHLSVTSLPRGAFFLVGVGMAGRAVEKGDRHLPVTSLVRRTFFLVGASPLFPRSESQLSGCDSGTGTMTSP